MLPNRRQLIPEARIDQEGCPAHGELWASDLAHYYLAVLTVIKFKCGAISYFNMPIKLF